MRFGKHARAATKRGFHATRDTEIARNASPFGECVFLKLQVTNNLPQTAASDQVRDCLAWWR
jgi:hypothetical protein